MKTVLVLIWVSLFLCFIALTAAVFEHLALHDIWHDYVSREVVEAFGPDFVSNLPGWSETAMEWWVVTVGRVCNVVYLTVSVATFVVCLRFLRQ